MFRIHLRLCFIAALVIGLPSITTADENDARKSLGQGIHHLHQGQLAEAIASFDVASVELSQDPRVYFFRGIAKSRTGQADAAKSDFQRGAQLEAFLGRQDIGLALQRIQGVERITIEEHRADARKLAKSRKLTVPDTNADNGDSNSGQAVSPVVVSEIPGEEDLAADENDPFSGENPERLGRGDAVAIPEAAAPTEPQIAADEGDVFGDFDDNANNDDSFPADDDFGNAEFDDSNFGATENPQGGSGSGAFGAIFRALTRTAAPGGEALMRNIGGAVPIPGVDAPAMDDDEGFTFDENESFDGEFGDGEFTEAASEDADDPFGSGAVPRIVDDEGAPLNDGFNSEDTPDEADDSDPFGDDSDPFGGDADPFGDDADPFGDDADPFGDDEDPFGS